MNFLLDTCVISELVKPSPNKNVVDWIRSCHEANLFLSSITIGEIQKGISKLPDSKRKDDLQKWLDDDLIERFEGRLLGIDIRVAKKWGEIQAISERRGLKIPVVDCLIASVGIVHKMTVVTRNIEDMKPSGVMLYDPWP